MQLKDRINALVQLGEKMTPQNDALQAIVRRTALGNGWFTEDNQWKAISAIKNAFLERNNLEDWTNKYDFKKDTPSVKETKIHKIALIFYSYDLYILSRKGFQLMGLWAKYISYKKSQIKKIHNFHLTSWLLRLGILHHEKVYMVFTSNFPISQ